MEQKERGMTKKNEGGKETVENKKDGRRGEVANIKKRRKSGVPKACGGISTSFSNPAAQTQDEGIHWFRLEGQQMGPDPFSSSASSRIMTPPLLSPTHTSHLCPCIHAAARSDRYNTAVTAKGEMFAPASQRGSADDSAVVCHQSSGFMLIALEKWLTQEFKCSEEKF